MAETPAAPAPTGGPAPEPANTPAPAPATLAAGEAGGTPAATPAAEGETKPAEGETKPAGETVAFDGGKLTLPEGYTIPPAAMEKFSGLAKEFGITQEAAQKLVNLQAETLKEGEAQSQAGWAKQQETWVNEIKKDPEVGGPKFEANVLAVKKVVDLYGAPGFKDALNLTGAGNNPAVFKTFVKIAALLTEGTNVQGQPPSTKAVGGGDPLESMASRMYPNMSPK